MKFNLLRTTPHATLAESGQICFTVNWAPPLLPAVPVYPGASTGRSIATAALLGRNAQQPPPQPAPLESGTVLSCRHRVRQEPQLWDGAALGILWLSCLWAIVISFVNL